MIKEYITEGKIVPMEVTVKVGVCSCNSFLSVLTSPINLKDTRELDVDPNDEKRS